MIHVLSLGAGVQSSTMALMFAKGELTPMPDCAIFADTQAEPNAVYRWLEWLELRLPFEVHQVTQGNLLDEVLDPNRGYNPIPAYKDGSIGRRQCTYQFKLRPLHRKMRELAGLGKGKRSKGVEVVSYVGISHDEVFRMKASEFAWLENRWPLVEKRMTRGHCLEWMERNGHPKPPRSACVFCPYKSDEEWKHTKKTDARGWETAIKVDAKIGIRGERLHRSEKPLAEIELTDNQRDMFTNECEGMCGV